MIFLQKSQHVSLKKFNNNHEFELNFDVSAMIQMNYGIIYSLYCIVHFVRLSLLNIFYFIVRRIKKELLLKNLSVSFNIYRFVIKCSFTVSSIRLAINVQKR